MLNDIPLAAKVVNASRKTKYVAKYLDGEQKKYWRGNNGKNLTVEANLIAGTISEKKLTYFGIGRVRFLKWKLKGPAFLSFSYWPGDGKSIEYDMKIIAAPGQRSTSLPRIPSSRRVR